MKSLFLSATAFLACLGQAAAQQSIGDQMLDKSSGSRVEIRGVFDPAPPSGFAPVRVVATQGVNTDTVWDFSFESEVYHYRGGHTHTSRFSLPMQARSTQSALFLVPMAMNYGDASGYSSTQTSNLKVSLVAPGLATREFSTSNQHAPDFPSVAISKGLSNRNMADLRKEMESRRKAVSRWGGTADEFGSEFRPEDLPEDWRGFSGFDDILISDNEWAALKPGVRLALLQWVRLGGRLTVYQTPGAPPLADLPETVRESGGNLSLGKVSFARWDGTTLDADKTVGALWGADKRVTDLGENYSSFTNGRNSAPEWQLMQKLGSRSFASWQVVIFLVIFGLLVGPINLFVLAPAGKRHKLFTTTPLLSVGASLFMVVIILFQDGIGGDGVRLVVVNLEPAEATAYVTQEQVCRTGVLMGTSFSLKQPALVEPLALPDSPWVKLKSNGSTQTTQLMLAGNDRSGNYFQSRAEQGHLLRAAVSSRARVELKAGTGVGAGIPPEVISTLAFPLEELFYVDAKGIVWKSDGVVQTGHATRLVASDTAALRTRWEFMIESSGGDTRDRLLRLVNGTPPRSTFFARADRADEFLLPTLDSIRWARDRVALYGPVALP